MATSKPDINKIFETMEYGPALESPAATLKWLEAHDKQFGLFINNQYVKPEGRKYVDSIVPCNKEQVLAQTIQAEKVDVDEAVAAARTAFGKWSKTSGYERARVMYNIARHLQKHHKLLSVLEALDNGKPFVESWNADVKLLERHFYFYAGWAQLIDQGRFEGQDVAPVGVIAQVIPWNFPLMMLAWKIAPAIACGNTVVLKPASPTRLSALLFAEICAEAGLPAGVINIITAPGSIGGYLCSHPDVDKVAFTGSTGVGQDIRRAIAGSGKKLSLELGGKSPIVVFDSADLDGVVEGVVQAIFFNQGQVCCAGSRLLVQESVFNKVIDKLKRRLGTWRIQHSLDKCTDMGALVDKAQYDTVVSYVEIAKKEGCDVWQPAIDVPTNGYYFPPTLITNCQPTSRCTQEEIFGPVLVAMSFRTEAEGIALANNTRFGLGASVWSDNINLALEVAHKIRAGVVWVNAHNLFDAAAGFGGYGESGYGREGGREGLYEYLRPAWHERHGERKPPKVRDIKEWSAYINAAPMVPEPVDDLPANGTRIDRTYKMYIGGKQKRPDMMHSRVVTDANGKRIADISEGSRKDIRDAVEAAMTAWPGWSSTTPFLRAQILYYIAENMQTRDEEFSSRISSMTGVSIEEARLETAKAIERMFYWAAQCDKAGGYIQETPWKGFTLQVNESVGTIGIVCPDESPLLAFVSLVGPAIARGNSVVVIPSEKFPLVAMDMYQIFDTSDLPGGVVNIVSGPRNVMTKTLAEHQNLHALWFFGDAEGSYYVDYLSASSMKRSWVNNGEKRDWFDHQQGAGYEFLQHSVECKNIWVPVGEQAFW